MAHLKENGRYFYRGHSFMLEIAGTPITLGHATSTNDREDPSLVHLTIERAYTVDEPSLYHQIKLAGIRQGNMWLLPPGVPRARFFPLNWQGEIWLPFSLSAQLQEPARESVILENCITHEGRDLDPAHWPEWLCQMRQK